MSEMEEDGRDQAISLENQNGSVEDSGGGGEGQWKNQNQQQQQFGDQQQNDGFWGGGGGGDGGNFMPQGGRGGGGGFGNQRFGPPRGAGPMNPYMGGPRAPFGPPMMQRGPPGMGPRMGPPGMMRGMGMGPPGMGPRNMGMGPPGIMPGGMGPPMGPGIGPPGMGPMMGGPPMMNMRGPSPMGGGPPRGMPPPMRPDFSVPPPGYANAPGSDGDAGEDKDKNEETADSLDLALADGLLEGELWVENSSDDGKCYYYNARTRESTWTKPEGDNIKIITQQEVQKLAAKQQEQQAKQTTNESQTQSQEQIQNGPQMGGPGPQMGGPGPQMGGPQMAPGMGGGYGPQMGPMGPPQMGPMGPPYGFPPGGQMGGGYGMAGPMNQMGPHPSRFQGGPDFNQPPPTFSGPGSNMNQMNPAGGAMSMDASGGGGGAMMNQSGATDTSAAAVAQPDPGPVSKIPAEGVEGWTEHFNTDGRPYYYNSNSEESVWEKPQCLVDYEAKLAEGAASSTATETGTTGGKRGGKDGGGEDDQMDTGEDQVEEEDDEDEEDEEEEEEEEEPVKSQQDKNKPVCSTPVSGTPWCVVWTGDGRVFYYNPTQRSSVWELPEELVDRDDVAKIIANPPESKKEAKAKKKAAQAKSSDEPAHKKSRDDDESKGGRGNKPAAAQKKKAAQIEVGKEAAIEAELKAAKERANTPLETRMKQFREMLAEKQVSAFSTWEKELHKIVFDPRYLLLTSKERKSVFDQYVKERADEERREKKSKLKASKEMFKQLMEDARLSSKSSFAEFQSKHGKDERFRAIEKQRERENMFSDFLRELRRREKEERSYEKEKMKSNFLELLQEQKDLNYKSRWSEVKKRIDSDSRYKAVDSSGRREDWFRDYIRDLDVNESDEEDKRRTEKAKRAEDSLRERQKEVEESLKESLKERDKEREQHKHAEAVQQFKALLADLVKNHEVDWRDARKQLKKDSRYSACESIGRDERETLFDDHIDELQKRNKEMFHKLLDEAGSTLTTTWKEIRKKIKEDPRFSKFSSSDRRREKEYDNFMQERFSKAKTAFRDLLKENKFITYKTKTALQENDNVWKDIIAVLENDNRYLVMEAAPEERDKILRHYIDELDKAGVPPPPTATEPNRRPLGGGGGSGGGGGGGVSGGSSIGGSAASIKTGGGDSKVYQPT